MNKTFSSFKEASEYAKKMAISGCNSVKCTPRNDGYYEVTANPSVANTTVLPDENRSFETYVAISTQSSKTQESLKSPTQNKKKAPHTKKASVVAKVKPGCCTQCGKKIPKERLAIAPNSKYCVPCLGTLESKNPDNFRRIMDVDGIGGTRQDARRTMRNRHR